MKVYVVTSGTYSDYRIESVFTDKALADAYVLALNEGRSGFSDDARIEEYEADAVDMRGKLCWRVWMDVDGNVRSCNRTNYDIADNSVLHSTGGYIDGKTWENGHFLVSNMVCESAEQAIKVMNERRTAWILEHGSEVGR